MQKICLLIFFSIFLLGFNFFSAKAYSAIYNLSAISSSQPETISYELPYPGILPDNPLYFLRVTRDWVVGVLISDPLKKAEFDLLQADKRLNAGISLFYKGKISLALSTISKAENYFSEALDKVGEAKMQGKSVGEINGRLKDALKKHEQELKILTEKASKDSKQNFEKELRRATLFEERLNR
jgi:hypothetical protein